jgi:uncharacterized protein (DUF1778 family)
MYVHCGYNTGTISFMATTTASSEITFRVSLEDKELIKLAAEIANSSVSDYVRSLAVQRAMELVSYLRLREVTVIPAAQFNALMASIDEPDEIAPHMRSAYDNLWKLELD